MDLPSLHSDDENDVDVTQTDITPLAANMPTGLKIATWNIQRLSSKIDQIRLILRKSRKEAAIIGFSETWLTSEIENKDIKLQGYKLVSRRDRPHNRWGGVAMYVNDDLPADDRPDLQHTDVEAVLLELKYPHSKPILIGTIYRTPDSLVEWYDVFTDMMGKVYAENKEMIILGDLNLDFLKPDYLPRRWKDTMDTFNLTQLVEEPTRITETSRTCIDHVYVTNTEHVRSVAVPHIVLSDHFPACYLRKHHAAYHTGKHTTITYRSYKDFDEIVFVQDLKSAPWNILDTLDNPNDALPEMMLRIQYQILEK